MTLIALFSDKGSPGVTTLGLALAQVWPRPLVLVELDPAGGDLALRLTDHHARPVLRPEPGLLTLAAAARRDSATSLWDHGQPLLAGGRALVIPGLSAPEQGAAMRSLWELAINSLGTVGDGDVIADLGRLDIGSPVLSAAGEADVLVAVGRAEPAAMLRLRDRLSHVLEALGPKPDRRALVVLVAEDRRSAEAAAAMREVLARGDVPAEVAGIFALDPSSVADLYTTESAPRLQRSLLMRTSRALATHISANAAPAPARGRRLLARTR
ncbi:MAG: hypothetical protein ACT4P1_11140 [Sporichthyaceae bacterium]